jgi:hypothetical protein
MPVEVPKRLEPTKSTVRRLFAFSGNRCAFDPCEHELIDDAGNFVAEICHIRGALPAGERFDPSMSNEERRAPENLLLMCHRHHVVTNDVGIYPVEAMERIKAAHEARFAAASLDISDEQIDQAVQDFVDSDIADRTVDAPYGIPVTCGALNRISGWGVSDEDAADSAREYAEYVQKLRRVPVDARAVLSVAVDRGRTAGYMGSVIECLLTDVVLATRRTKDEIRELCAVLERWGVARAEFDESENAEFVIVSGHGDVGNVWDEIRHFAKETGMTVRDFAVGLRFDALDEGP